MSKFHITEDDLSMFIGNAPSVSEKELEGFVVDGDLKKEAELAQLQKLSDLLDKYEQASMTSGMDKWFVMGTPFGIENCPKHRAFFDAGADYNERLFLAANR